MAAFFPGRRPACRASPEPPSQVPCRPRAGGPSPPSPGPRNLKPTWAKGLCAFWIPPTAGSPRPSSNPDRRGDMASPSALLPGMGPRRRGARSPPEPRPPRRRTRPPWAPLLGLSLRAHVWLRGRGCAAPCSGRPASLTPTGHAGWGSPGGGQMVRLVGTPESVRDQPGGSLRPGSPPLGALEWGPQSRNEGCTASSPRGGHPDPEAPGWDAGPGVLVTLWSPAGG